MAYTLIKLNIQGSTIKAHTQIFFFRQRSYVNYTTVFKKHALSIRIWEYMLIIILSWRNRFKAVKY